jgi:hypothetical protein
MSWAGFKKNVNRATTQVMMKTGHVERTSDRDYEVEERYLGPTSSTDSSDSAQAIQNNGGGGEPVTERG